MIRAALFVAVLAAGGFTAVGQQPAPTWRGLRVEFDERAAGVENCIDCHRQPTPRQVEAGVTRFIRLTESATFETDPHARAFRVLTETEAGKRMAAALGEPHTTRRPECLACHTVAKPSADKIVFSLPYGVSCEACHGWRDAAWYSPHSISDWRTVAPHEKAAKGQTDLRDPAVRTARCASCHVGNLAEGKFITHEMYAAGHPPLLPFEPATFGRDQPAHWNLPERVPYLNEIPEADAERLFHYRRGDSFVARTVAVGSLAALRESARLLADAADEASTNGAVLDFAHFDCFACHHDLEQSSRRQKRGYPGPAGRPAMRPLPTDLAAAALRHAGRADRVAELIQAVGGLHAAFGSRPFGDTRAVAAAAQSLRECSEQGVADVSAARFGDGRGLLAAVAGRGGSWEYDSAQLAVWAARALDSYDEPSPRWEPLKAHVLLGAGLGRETAEARLAARLKLRYGFDPETFQTSWDRLRASLAPTGRR
jgi:hypothetical protein